MYKNFELTSSLEEIEQQFFLHNTIPSGHYSKTQGFLQIHKIVTIVILSAVWDSAEPIA